MQSSRRAGTRARSSHTHLGRDDAACFLVVTDGQARIKTFSLRGDELARLQEAHANGEALLQTDKTPDSDSETEAPADPNMARSGSGKPATSPHEYDLGTT